MSRPTVFLKSIGECIGLGACMCLRASMNTRIHVHVIQKIDKQIDAASGFVIRLLHCDNLSVNSFARSSS